MSKKRKRNNRSQGIGPIDVHVPPDAREIERIEDVEEPFKVDRNNPRQHRLASKIGWGRLYEIEREEREAFERAKEL